MIHYLVTVISLASAACAAVIAVTVGSGGLVLSPNSITAAVNDTINFQFPTNPSNHTVSQAAFAAPCAQLSGGFDSGFVSVSSGSAVEWNLTISDASNPIWFYCKQKSPSPHCLAGMVGAINPPSSGNTLAAFTAAAKALSSLPDQSSGTLNGVGASASAAPSVPGAATTSSGASATSTAPSSSGSSTASSSPNAAFRTSSISGTGIWTLLASVLGVVVV